MRIMLDLDGVLADFVGAACRIHKKPYAYLNGNCAGMFGLHRIWGMSQEDFWKPINEGDFWLNLERTREADAIVEMCVRHVTQKNVYIVTSPADGHLCIPHKQEWVKRAYPELATRMVFTHVKQACASPLALLIDDYDDNIAKFRAAGGKAILVPRDWNSGYRMAAHTLDHLKFSLEQR